MLDTSAACANTNPTFRDLIRYLADEVGRHQIPVRDRAVDIHGFIGPDAVHHELVTDVVRAIYKANHCGHLDAPIHAVPTFNTLGKIRARLSRSRHADVDQINLIDSIGWNVNKRLETETNNVAAIEAVALTQDPRQAAVIPLRPIRALTLD